MSSTAAEWMKGYVWPEIEAMMLNDAHFRLVLTARQLTKKFSGPTAKLLQDGYLTYQMVTIRRLCDKDADVFSLRAVLRKAKEEQPQVTQQIDRLSGNLSKCDHVCEQVNKHVAHTANPAQSRKWVEWDMGMKDLETAHKAICQTAITLDRDILHWGLPIEIMPIPQYYFGEDLMLWVPEQLQDKLNQSWHDNRKRVNAWKSL